MREFAEYLRQNRVAVISAGLIVYLMVLPVMAFTNIMGDDWMFIFAPRSRVEWLYGVGRVGHDYVRALLAPLVSPHYFVVLYVGGLLVCAVTLAFLFRVSKAMHLGLLILLFVMFPLHIDNMYYKDNNVPLAVAFVFASAYLIVLFGAEAVTPARIATLVALMLCAALTHQAVAIFIVTAFFAVWLVNQLNGRSGFDSVKTALPLLLWSTAIAALLSVPIIYIHRKTLLQEWPIPREYLLFESLNRTPAEFLNSFLDFVQHFSIFLYREQVLLPLPIKVVFLFMTAIVLHSIARKQQRKSVLPLLVFLAFLLTPWALALIRNSWTSYKYTAMGLPLAVIYPTVFLLYVRSVREGSLLHNAGIVAAGIVVLFFFQALSTVTFAAKTNVDRDYLISQRILSDVDYAIRQDALSLDDDHVLLIQVRSPASYGEGPPFNGLEGAQSLFSTMGTCSVYYCNTSMVPNMLRIIDLNYRGKRRYILSERPWEWQNLKVAPPNASDLLKEMTVWPRKGSVRVVGQTVLVKLGE